VGKNSRRAGAAAVLDPGDVPVVGGREPCPCGSGRRYKACHGRAAREESARLVARPFEGLVGECDWVALREIVPAATARVRLTAEHGGDPADVVTVLPLAWPAMRRPDGEVFLAVQTTAASVDPSRDLAGALLAAVAAEPGTPVEALPDPGAGDLRLQDVLDPEERFEVTVHDGFDFWLDGVAEIPQDVSGSLERANSAVVPTARLASVEAAYWCRIGTREHLRWVMPEAEEDLFDGLARLHAAGVSAVMPGARYVGAFRAHGLLVPVWDLPAGTGAEELEKPAAAFRHRLAESVADDAPLSAEQRRARAGVTSRQLTLR
jgi:hypothetical protein